MYKFQPEIIDQYLTGFLKKYGWRESIPDVAIWIKEDYPRYIMLPVTGLEDHHFQAVIKNLALAENVSEEYVYRDWLMFTKQTDFRVHTNYWNISHFDCIFEVNLNAKNIKLSMEDRYGEYFALAELEYMDVYMLQSILKEWLDRHDLS